MGWKVPYYQMPGLYVVSWEWFWTKCKDPDLDLYAFADDCVRIVAEPGNAILITEPTNLVISNNTFDRVKS